MQLIQNQMTPRNRGNIFQFFQPASTSQLEITLHSAALKVHLFKNCQCQHCNGIVLFC